MGLFCRSNKKRSDIRSYSPIDYDIIRCGKGISSRPGYPKALYDDHVKWHESEKKHHFVSTPANYIDNIVESETLTEFEAHAGAKKKAKVPMTSTESVYNYYAVNPMVELVCNSVDESGGCGFLSGEAALHAMKNINETSEAKYNYLADAIVK
ncbi:hypothetical protein G6F37_011467 [Rhizopus arrhizus]|nr:hypothetical protein G6F38_011543 [Rhizopus arrhizus]KAG1149182.1 hypothetical protein G6F37_011467 [Rhizopus arrhizus]